MLTLIIVMAPLLVAALVAAAVLVLLYPPLPRDLGGVPNLDHEAERLRIPVGPGEAVDGWWIPGSKPAVVVLFHGFGRTHHRAWRYAGFLRDLGVHLVTFDFRSSGARGRKPTTLGLHERRDAAAVLDWVRADPRFAGCSIGFHGESLGGAVALDLAAARPEVRCVVADAAFATARGAIEDSCELWARVPAQPSATLLRWMGRCTTGSDPYAFAPIERMGALRGRRLLLIHGTRDDRIRIGQAQAIWSAAECREPLWIVEGAGHNEAWHVERVEYERRVSAFFAEALLTGDPVEPAAVAAAAAERAPLPPPIRIPVALPAR